MQTIYIYMPSSIIKKSIWPTDGNLIGINILSLGGPRPNGNEEVPPSFQMSRCETSPSYAF